MMLEMDSTKSYKQKQLNQLILILSKQWKKIVNDEIPELERFTICRTCKIKYRGPSHRCPMRGEI